MTMKAKSYIFLLLALLMAVPVQAQRKAGRNGAAFLKVAVGARETALGSAATSMLGSANSIFWNPAGTALTADQTASISLSYNDWIADLNHNALAASYNLGAQGTVTVGFQSLGISDIPANRQNGYTDPILQDLVTDTQTGETYNYQDMALSVSYAKYFFDRLSLGATVKYVNESIDGESGSAIAFDFGSVYKVNDSGWNLAARIVNVGQPISFYNQDNPLPLAFSIGTSFMPVQTDAASLMLSLDTTKPLDTQQLVYGGAELSFYDMVYLRGGYKFFYSGSDDGGTSLRDPINTSIEGFSAGAGLKTEFSGYGFAVDYAYTQMDLLDAVHRISLNIGL
jgi:hypothetical protein